MTHYRRLWLSDGSTAREAVVSALSIDCPHCGQPLGPLVGRSYTRGAPCVCGAEIVREDPGPRWVTSTALLQDAFRQVRDRLQQSVIGHDLAVAQLALMAAQHAHGFGGQRALIAGAAGTGKTTLGTALAAALGCPVSVWDVGTSAQACWHGVDVSDVLAELYHACDSDVHALATAVVVLDEVDKVATRGASGTARDHRLGQQASILALVGGGTPIRFHSEGDGGPIVSVLTDRMMVIGLGAFDGLPTDVGPGDLVSYGYLTEFASRWSVLIRLEPLTDRALREILRAGVQQSLEAAKAFGYEVRLSRDALGHAAAAVRRGGDEVTPRAGTGWLRAAVDRLLVRLLDLGAPTDGVYEVRGDDLLIPPVLVSGDGRRR